MKRHVVISGEIGAGKSTLICRALGESLRYAGGFATVRIADGKKLEGFELTRVRELLSECPRGERFLDFANGVPYDPEVFRVHGAELLREAGERPFAVIDEVGGMELLIPEFYEALLGLLCSSKPWVCVLKTAKSVDRLGRSIAVAPQLAARVQELRETLLARDDTTEVVVHTRGDAEVMRALVQWAQEHANPAGERNVGAI